MLEQVSFPCFVTVSFSLPAAAGEVKQAMPRILKRPEVQRLGKVPYSTVLPDLIFSMSSIMSGTKPKA